MGKEALPFKGFAYKKNSPKPVVLYGHSQDEILGRLAEINSACGGDEKYINLSLGEYDALAGDYGNYRRLDAMTGKDTTPVYLELPRLSREEFTSTVAYLKENGAKFNTRRKQWYTTPDRAEQLQGYLAGKGRAADPRAAAGGQNRKLPENAGAARQEGSAAGRELPESHGDLPESHGKLPENVSRGLGMIDSADCKFELKLRDGSTMHLDMGAFLSRLGGHLKLEVDPDSLVNELAAEVDRRSRLVELDAEHTASVAGNRCAVCYTGPGRDRPPLVLEGDVLGVRFQELDDTGVKKVAEGWLGRHPGWEERLQAAQEATGAGNALQGELSSGSSPENAYGTLPERGDTVTMHVPVYEPFRNGRIITGVETVTGTLTKISGDPAMEGQYLYTLKSSVGERCISTRESYSHSQAEFLRSIARRPGFGKEEFDVVATPGLPLERMEMIYRGIHEDGLVAGQAAYMAAPSLAGWQADAWRMGMKYGLLCRDISPALEYYGDDAEGCRKYLETLATDHRHEMLRDIKSHGYNPSPVVMARIDRIRGMLQKDWKLSDICQAYRQRTYETHPAGREIDSLAGDLRKQEAARIPPAQER